MNRDERRGHGANLGGKPFNPDENIDWQRGWNNAQDDRRLDDDDQDDWFDDAKETLALDVCPECDGGGWIQVYSPSPPAFGECPTCYNQERIPSP